VYLGENLFYYGEVSYDLGGSATLSTGNTVKIWEILYNADGTNDLVIYRYDSDYDWYADYNVLTDECPFCGGTGVRNDLALTPIGRLQVAFDTDKLVQCVLKAVLTPQGKNVYYPNYGTGLIDAIGSKNTTSGPNSLTPFTLRDQIMKQLTIIKQTQEGILNQSLSFYTAQELLDDIVGIKLLPTTSVKVMHLVVTILNRALEKHTSKAVILA
jgi:hypothetical protein